VLVKIAETPIAATVIIRKMNRNVLPIGSGIRNAIADTAMAANEAIISVSIKFIAGFGS
jgi:hypothetical protein